jgi:two-component system, NarL family, invasion response regulator UvrY
MKVLLVDDHATVRRGVREILRDAFPKVQVHEAESLSAMSSAMAEREFDLVMLDLSFPDHDGFDALPSLVRTWPRIPILIFSMHAERTFALRALQAGAAGYVGKERAPEELVYAVRRVIRGGRYISPELADSLVRQPEQVNTLPPLAHASLSAREFRVLRLIAVGRTLAAMSAELHISTKTISTYRARVLSKLGLSTNADLVRYCLQQGLIE